MYTYSRECDKFELGSEEDQITVKKEIIENEYDENELNKTKVETKIAYSEKLQYLPSSILDNIYAGKTKFHYDLILFEDSKFVNESLVEEFSSFSCLKIDIIGFAYNLEDFCKLVKSIHDAVLLVASYSMLNSPDLLLALKDLLDFNEIKRKCILLVTYDNEFDTDVADTDIEILCKLQGEDFKYLWTQCEHRAVLFDTTTTDVLTKTEQMLNLLKHVVEVTHNKKFEEIPHPYKLYKDDFNTTSEEMEVSESGDSKHTYVCNKITSHRSKP
ncbi:uncharacterized protein LOC131927651 [Physella acuta]|uniref:uncharacterized protein LOC131927651 n=1 Tax=Physella acuta TaxID=109671 RepID=UPI0027DC48ED|nr:uncharacterized protein LOC131927651 [Physella acuta]